MLKGSGKSELSEIKGNFFNGFDKIKFKRS